MLFLSDLDGTLMDSNGNVTDEDVECIHQWTQKHAFGFVTGYVWYFGENLLVATVRRMTSVSL